MVKSVSGSSMGLWSLGSDRCSVENPSTSSRTKVLLLSGFYGKRDLQVLR